ncbi:thioredoxin family protein [Oxalobacteraceae bacterium R-40]|uniref:Thioredoxin family protein n=1 Tax=Keguizhuia sedimenti TaxID=3064264 RepID=A0ABU1BVK6_9BURK|nr:thioredoxin family protein [Oxalobacteraceae bacterium R-40]
MPMNRNFAAQEPARTEVDAYEGPTLLEFGAPWCPHCQAVQPLLEEAFAHHPGVRHIKIEDGKGKPLGRSYRVKLWPTLIFLSNGTEVDRLVRSGDGEELRRAMEKIDPTVR